MTTKGIKQILIYFWLTQKRAKTKITEDQKPDETHKIFLIDLSPTTSIII